MLRLLKTLLTLTVFLPVSVLAYVSPGAPVGFVNDFAGVLSVDQVASLEQQVQAYEQATDNEIAVVTITDLGGDSIENYANKLFNEWGIGKEGKDNGVLILAAINDRQMRIEVGYGLEPYLTDLETQIIQTEIMRPAFRDGDYYGGLSGAVTGVGQVVAGEDLEGLPTSQFEGAGSLDAEEKQIVFGVLPPMILLFVLIAIFIPESVGWWMILFITPFWATLALFLFGSGPGGVAGIIIYLVAVPLARWAVTIRDKKQDKKFFAVADPLLGRAVFYLFLAPFIAILTMNWPWVIQVYLVGMPILMFTSWISGLDGKIDRYNKKRWGNKYSSSGGHRSSWRSGSGGSSSGSSGGSSSSFGGGRSGGGGSSSSW